MYKSYLACNLNVHWNFCNSIRGRCRLMILKAQMSGYLTKKYWIPKCIWKEEDEGGFFPLRKICENSINKATIRSARKIIRSISNCALSTVWNGCMFSFAFMTLLPFHLGHEWSSLWGSSLFQMAEEIQSCPICKHRIKLEVANPY